MSKADTITNVLIGAAYVALAVRIALWARKRPRNWHKAGWHALRLAAFGAACQVANFWPEDGITVTLLAAVLLALCIEIYGAANRRIENVTRIKLTKEQATVLNSYLTRETTK